MLSDLERLGPSSARFPGCPTCVYRRSGTPAICFPCAVAGDPAVTAPRCALCGQPLDGPGPCPNTVCALEDPYFARIHTVCDRPEDMWDAIMDYKYGEDRTWAEVFGRIIVGHLDEHRELFERYDVITTGAIYVGPRAQRLWDYLSLILDAAARVGPEWPFAPGLIAKAGPTPRFLGISAEARQEIAEGELRAALSVPEPHRVAGRRVLVFDDVYSEGFSLREMARVLLEAGATEVAGLVLARRKGG
jgi:predicted amidophosphoribosyltransferase